MKKYFLKGLLLFFCAQACAQNLPGRHQLIKNDLGEYYVINHENMTMIEASILKLGFSSRWILACIKNESIDIDLKRWIFIDLKSGGTFDSLH